MHLEGENGGHDVIVSGSLTKSFDNDLSVYASPFWETGVDKSYGAFAGLSMPLGKTLLGSANLSTAGKRVTATASLGRPLDGAPQSYGWQVTHGEGERPVTTATAAYQGDTALLQAAAWQNGHEAGGNVSADGALVLADGGLFLGNRIDEAFAVVDAGAEGVPVRLENRKVGTTGKSGKLLVTGLKSYQRNKISIDVDNLPVTADIPKTESFAVPMAESGMTVDFGIRPDRGSAIVVLTDGDGKVLDVGTPVTLSGSSDPFIVGFDGEVYLTGLGPSNTVEATAHTMGCSASFAFTPKPGEQQTIGPLKCI
jgi:outer membrane usher protein